MRFAGLGKRKGRVNHGSGTPRAQQRPDVLQYSRSDGRLLLNGSRPQRRAAASRRIAHRDCRFVDGRARLYHRREQRYQSNQRRAASEWRDDIAQLAGVKRGAGNFLSIHRTSEPAHRRRHEGRAESSHPGSGYGLPRQLHFRILFQETAGDQPETRGAPGSIKIPETTERFGHKRGVVHASRKSMISLLTNSG